MPGNDTIARAIKPQPQETPMEDCTRRPGRVVDPPCRSSDTDKEKKTLQSISESCQTNPNDGEEDSVATKKAEHGSLKTAKADASVSKTANESNSDDEDQTTVWTESTNDDNLNVCAHSLGGVSISTPAPPPLSRVPPRRPPLPGAFREQMSSPTLQLEPAALTAHAGHRGAPTTSDPQADTSTITYGTVAEEDQGFHIVAEAQPVLVDNEGNDDDDEWKQRLRDLEEERQTAPRAEVVQHSKRPSRVTMIAITGVLFASILVAAGLAIGLRKSSEDDPNSVAATLPPTMPLAVAPALERILERDSIVCRVNPAEMVEGRDQTNGSSIGVCRALATAILGDPDKAVPVNMILLDAFAALINGAVNILASGHIATMEREIGFDGEGVRCSEPHACTFATFAGVPEYVQCAEDGDSLTGNCRDLAVCVEEKSVHEAFVRDQVMGTSIAAVDAMRNWFEGLEDGTCNVTFGVAPHLAEPIARAKGCTGPYYVSEKRVNWVAVSFVTRQDDDGLGDMLDWMMHAQVAAEALNVTNETAANFPSTNVFGPERTLFFQKILATSGNYGQWPLWNAIAREAINLPCLETGRGLLFANPLGEIDDVGMPHAQLTGTLERIASTEILKCGIITSDRPGLAEWNATTGDFEGVDVDFCRAVAAALHARDAPENLILVELQAAEDGFLALADGEIDVFAGAPYTLANDALEPTTGQGFAFATKYYYDEHVDGSVLPLAMATKEGDEQWADFVSLITTSIIYAELRNITQDRALEMPVLEVYGPKYRQALRDVILQVGNYAESYERNMEDYIPRVNNLRNALNLGDSSMFFADFKFE